MDVWACLQNEQIRGREVIQLDWLNFILTNYLPRKLASRFMGWFSRIEQPFVRDVSLWCWQTFSPELDLTEARKTVFKSLHDCFTRELKVGARPLDLRENVIVSPCDAIVGAHGTVLDGDLIQVKGFPYKLADLLMSDKLAAHYEGGKFVTLRLKATMYHRFHAPCDASVVSVDFIPGDMWNVNPPTLARIEKLFCKNERAVIQLSAGADLLTLVPVAAILVASLKLNWLAEVLDSRCRNPVSLKQSVSFRKGDEMGYFQHGSTIILLSGQGYNFHSKITGGCRIRMGEPLLVEENLNK